jgi:tetratricopeptide (TPR) repeat protein
MEHTTNSTGTVWKSRIIVHGSIPDTQNPKPKTQNPKLNNHHGEALRQYLWALLFAISYFLCALTRSPLLAADAPETTLPKLSDEARSAAAKGLFDFQNQKFEDAKTEFQKMIDLAPDHPMGWANLGSAEFRLGEVAQAEEHLKKAVRLDPTAQQAWLTLGIIDYQKDELDAGLAALSQAVYLDPRDPKAHLYLGILIRKRGWLAAAEDEMRKAIDLDETYAEAHYNLAVLYLERQPPAIELARRHYYRALNLGAEPDAELDHLLKKPDAGAETGASTN